MTEPKPIFLVVVAAGLGSRLAAATRKASVSISGIPLVVRALRAFDTTPGAVGGALVVHRDDLERAERDWIPEASAPFDWQPVLGGETRAESVAAGLATMEPSAQLLLVHDAARPLLHPDDRDAVIEEAAEGGAILAAPITDTIQRVERGEIRETVDRRGLWGAQTPQVIPVSAYRHLLTKGPLWGTDEATALAAAGITVRVVEARHPNPKVTHPSDLPLVESLLKG